MSVSEYTARMPSTGPTTNPIEALAAQWLAFQPVPLAIIACGAIDSLSVVLDQLFADIAATNTSVG